MKNQIFKFSLFAVVSISCFAVSSAWAEEENRMAKGAMVGAGTNVIGGAVLDSLDGSNQPQYVQSYGPDGQPYWQQVNLGPQDPNKTILKRAVQGAITGAAAAEFSGNDENSGSSGNAGSSSVSSDNSERRSWNRDDDDEDDDDDRKGHKKSKSKGKKDKDRDGHRPPGWDKGKKVGWGDGDVPPGHQDEIEHPEVENEKENKNWWSGLFGGKDED